MLPLVAEDMQGYIATIPFLEFSEYLQVALALQGLYVISRGVTGFMLSTIMDEAQ